MKKQKPNCAVDGDLGRVWGHFAMCAYVSIGGKCGAHGNKKCEHKQPVEPEVTK